MMGHNDCCPSMKIWKGICLLIIAFFVWMQPYWGYTWTEFFGVLIAIFGVKMLVIGIKHGCCSNTKKKK